MPEVKQHYNDLAERQAWIKMWEDQKYRMLHDDFDADWKRGDEPRGTMTFTDEPEAVAPPPPLSEIELKVDDLLKRVEKLEKKVR